MLITSILGGTTCLTLLVSFRYNNDNNDILSQLFAPEDNNNNTNNNDNNYNNDNNDNNLNNNIIICTNNTQHPHTYTASFVLCALRRVKEHHNVHTVHMA